MKKLVRYDQLEVGDVISFHGAREIVIGVSDCGESKTYPGESVIRFDLAPYDNEAEEMLGPFYSRGTYGGVGFIEVELLERIGAEQ